jgi:mRNA interferase HicA
MISIKALHPTEAAILVSRDPRTLPVKRHRTLDRIPANQLCKQVGLQPKF